MSVKTNTHVQPKVMCPNCNTLLLELEVSYTWQWMDAANLKAFIFDDETLTEMAEHLE